MKQAKWFGCPAQATALLIDDADALKVIAAVWTSLDCWDDDPDDDTGGTWVARTADGIQLPFATGRDAFSAAESFAELEEYEVTIKWGREE